MRADSSLRLVDVSKSGVVPPPSTSGGSGLHPATPCGGAGSFSIEEAPTAVLPRTPRRASAVSATPRDSAAGRYQILAPDHGVTEVRGRWRACAGAGATAPAVWNSAAARRQADEYFGAAEQLMADGYIREAVFQAQRGMRLCEPRPEQLALYAWLLHQRSGGGPHVARRIWYLLDRALCADPDCETAHAFRARLARLQPEG